jgi:cytochrome c oxidase assembly factor CtaG
VGAPVALAAAALSPARRKGLARFGRVPLVRVLRLPGVGPLLLILATVVVFFTPLLQVSLSDPVAFHVLHLLLLTTGMVMALPVTDEGVSLSSSAYAVMVGLGLLEFLLDAVPGDPAPAARRAARRRVLDHPASPLGTGPDG